MRGTDAGRPARGPNRLPVAALQHTAHRIRLAWLPGYTVAAIIAALLIAGFLPFIKMGLVVNGFVLGAIIATGAIGLTLIYGNLTFANIAHGDYMTMGAYLSFSIITGLLPIIGIQGQGLGPFSFGYPLLIALPLAAAAVALGAIALDALIYRRLRNRRVNTVVIAMTSLGLGIAVRGLIQIIWTAEKLQFPRESRQVYHLPMDVRIPPRQHLHCRNGRRSRRGCVSATHSNENRQGHAGYGGQSGPGSRHRDTH